MTKAVPPRPLPLTTRDGNQEDAHAPETSRRVYLPLQQQQSPDWDEVAETRGTGRPTSLEELLDLELDLVLPVAIVPGPKSNQLPVSVAREELEVEAVSLELLAMQSPHGENQQWQSEDEEEQNVVPTTRAAPVQPEMQSPRRKMKEQSSARKPMPLNLVSPSAFAPSFPPSPSRSSTDDDYGLASPMALPDTPSPSRSGIALTWDLEPTSPTDEDASETREVFRRLAQSKSVQRPERRASAVSVAARAATPNPRSFRNYERAAPRITRSSLPMLPEARGKARHGGIYSLLLKNKSAKQDPVLVEGSHNPEEVAAAPSDISEVSPPRTLGKQKHGGIYRMLRAASHASR